MLTENGQRHKCVQTYKHVYKNRPIPPLLTSEERLILQHVYDWMATTPAAVEKVIPLVVDANDAQFTGESLKSVHNRL